jgi:type II secretory pathway component GspD/PulD (secretin)
MDVQNVFSFLNGGLSNQTQVVGKYFAVNLALNWLESEGIARNVSDPVLTVLSGEQAQFGAGDVIFVQGTTTVSTGAVLATTLTPIQTGVTLSVRPLVGEDDTITLDVEPQVATPDTPPVAGGPPPSINIRGLSTSARLDDGQALLIGGLVTRDHSDNASYVPFLGQIPVIDLLFKNTSHNEDELELVIVLVPTIVREPSQIGAMWAHEDLRDLMHSATAPSAPR